MKFLYFLFLLLLNSCIILEDYYEPVLNEIPDSIITIHNNMVQIDTTLTQIPIIFEVDVNDWKSENESLNL